MSRKKKGKWKPAYLTLAVVIGIGAGLWLSDRFVRPVMPAQPVVVKKKQTGYKAKDRQRLEQLIHEGARHD